MIRFHFLYCAALTMLLALLSSDAMAQLGPASYRSLQAVVHNSEVVLLGKILAIDGEREQLGQATYKIRFEVEDVIKGGHREGGYFYLFANREQIEKWIQSRARLLLNSPYELYGNSESAGITVDLSKPKVMRLSLGEDGVLTTVNTTTELLEIMRKTAQRLPGVVQMRTFQMQTEPNFVKRANLQIQDGMPIVFVPVDKPLETWAKRVIAGDAELPFDHGVSALLNFRSEDNITWVRRAIETASDDSKRAALTGLLENWITSVASP